LTITITSQDISKRTKEIFSELVSEELATEAAAKVTAVVEGFEPDQFKRSLITLLIQNALNETFDELGIDAEANLVKGDE